MKRVISALLLLSILLSLSTAAFAAENEEPLYGYITVEYSDSHGTTEQLSVMNDNGHIYANANELCERLGYHVSDNYEYAAISNMEYGDLPVGVTLFYYDSCDVSHTLFNSLAEQYEAPFEAVRNEEGIWLPLEYTILILGGSSIIIDDVLQITVPEKSITDLFLYLLQEPDFPFDWNRDIGYSELDFNVQGGASHLINVFNGLLTFDGASWALLFQQFSQDFSAYDSKYGEDLALLICTNASKELEAVVNDIDKLNDIFSPKGTIGEFLDGITVSDEDIGELSSLCDKYLEEIQNSNSSSVYMYNRTFQQLENAISHDAWYSELADAAMEVQSGLSPATTVLEVGAKVAELTGYISEFTNQDSYAVSALQQYLNAPNGRDSYLPSATKDAMQTSIDRLNSNLLDYSGAKFIRENIDDLIQEGVSQVIGKQANFALLAWNLASDFIPFVSEGLQSANDFELAVYATVFQADAQRLYQSYRDEIFRDVDRITAENLTSLAAYCYIFLKSCLIAREAAIASLNRLSDSDLEKIQPLLDKQNAVNAEIAEYLAILKTADGTNQYLVFGFLPEDNEEYLKDYEQMKADSYLLEIFHSGPAIDYDGLVTDAYNYIDSYSDGYNDYSITYRIPKINLPSATVQKINSEIYNTLYYGKVEEELSNISAGVSVFAYEIIYDWAINEDILSLWITCRDAHSWTDYYVYNISVSTGSIIPDNTIASAAGISQTEYYDIVKQALGSAYFQDKESYIEQVGYDEFFYIQLRNTISDDNIQQCIPYLNENGQLCIVAAIYSLAGADYYFHEINLENFSLNSSFNEFMEMQANNSDSDSFVDQYKAILLQHPQKVSEYTLHDIDSNGTPELIVKQNMAEYYIYSFDGTDVISSDICYWFYDNCLYEYEGNGIIVHNGGQGSLRIEDVSLYSMVNNRLEFKERLMSTEECSFDELYAFLDSLTPIDSFHPISDDSFLSNQSN